MDKNVTILGIDGDEETGTAKIKMTPESEAYIQNMFPDKTMQEAVQAYYNLATQHLNNNDALKVGE